MKKRTTKMKVASPVHARTKRIAPSQSPAQVSTAIAPASKKLRILILNDVGFEEGGITAIIVYTRKALLKAGHEVRVLTSDFHAEKPTFRDYSFPATDARSPLRAKKYIYNIVAEQAVRAAIADFKPDIVHVHYFNYQLSPSVFTAIQDVPSVLTVHSNEIICPRATLRTADLQPCGCSMRGPCLACTGLVRYVPEQFRAALLHRLLRNVTQIITPSDFQRDMVRSWGYANTRTVHNGIVLQPAKPLPRTGHRILFIGRLEGIKGGHVLIGALKRIRESIPDLAVTIVGSGSEEHALLAQAKEAGVTDCITRVPWVSLADIAQYYTNCHLLVMPSVCPECYPTVIIEAMSVGRPTVASNIGGIPELVEDGVTGALFPPSDSQALADAVIRVLSARTTLTAMSAAARKKAQDLTVEAHVTELLSVYHETIETFNAKRT